MKREFNVLIERDAEGYYVASAPDLGGCHTQAPTLDKWPSRIKDAIALCMEVEKADEKEPSEFVAIQRVAVEV